MITVSIPNRPFASDVFTGLQLPDGIFEATLGRQRLNAYVQNIGAAPVTQVSVYLESVSHPGISVTPVTHSIPQLDSGVPRLFSWDVDVSGAPPGVHRVSFIVENPAGSRRIIKKIFVTRVQFHEATSTFSAETPEGTIKVRLKNLVKPKQGCYGGGGREEAHTKKEVNFLDFVKRLGAEREPKYELCLPGYLLSDFEIGIQPNPPFSGQYSDLPFEDPWWKVVLIVVMVILLIAAGVYAATTGSGNVGVTVHGEVSTDGSDFNCCEVRAHGRSSSYVVAGLVAAAAAAATAAGLSDKRDPIRRGQDNTLPSAGEVTIGESLNVSLRYPEPVALGRPFAVNAEWVYTRQTNARTYTYSVRETQENVHVLSRYVVNAPEVVRVYKREPFVVRAAFFGRKGEVLRGSQLFVQCFLFGPSGEVRSFVLEDDGSCPDAKALDGVYTGSYRFTGKDEGLWKYFVIAQDVNYAHPDMKPEEAAQIIGGMVVTHQLTIDFESDECPLIPDGHVQVV